MARCGCATAQSTTCDAIMSCIADNLGAGLDYNEETRQLDLRISTDAGNVATIGSDDGFYSPDGSAPAPMTWPKTVATLPAQPMAANGGSGLVFPTTSPLAIEHTISNDIDIYATSVYTLADGVAFESLDDRGQRINRYTDNPSTIDWGLLGTTNLPSLLYDTGTRVSPTNRNAPADFTDPDGGWAGFYSEPFVPRTVAELLRIIRGRAVLAMFVDFETITEDAEAVASVQSVVDAVVDAGAQDWVIIMPDDNYDDGTRTPLDAMMDIVTGAGITGGVNIFTDDDNDDPWTPAEIVASGATWVHILGPTRPEGVDIIDPGGLLVDGTAGSYASTPDAASLDITGDIDLRIVIALDDYSSGVNQTVLAKYGTTGDQRSYALRVNATGFPTMLASLDGASIISGTADADLYSAGVVDGQLIAMRVTRDATTGDITHYLGDEASVTPSGWTQLGSTLSRDSGSLHSGTAVLEVASLDDGASMLATGLIVHAQVRSGIDGAIAADPDFSDQPNGTTSFADSTGKTWTVHGTATISDAPRITDLVNAGLEVMVFTNSRHYWTEWAFDLGARTVSARDAVYARGGRGQAGDLDYRQTFIPGLETRTAVNGGMTPLNSTQTAVFTQGFARQDLPGRWFPEQYGWPPGTNLASNNQLLGTIAPLPNTTDYTLRTRTYLDPSSTVEGQQVCGIFFASPDDRDISQVWEEPTPDHVNGYEVSLYVDPSLGLDLFRLDDGSATFLGADSSANWVAGEWTDLTVTVQGASITVSATNSTGTATVDVSDSTHRGPYAFAIWQDRNAPMVHGYSNPVDLVMYEALS